jgi:hypothetical protein
MLFDPDLEADFVTGFMGNTNYYNKKIKERQ